MTQSECRALWVEISAELNLVGWTFEFDSSKRRFGCCYHHRRVISMSRPLVELNDAKRVGQTIRHEIAHALVGPGHGHDHVWRAMSLKCGDDGQRCYNEEDTETPDAPFIAVCPGCGVTFKKHRRPKSHRLQSCGKCSGGRFNQLYQLVWTENQAMPQKPASEVTPSHAMPKVTFEVRAAVMKLRDQGHGYVAIDAAFGIVGKKGWWSWKIVKEAKNFWK